MAALDHDGDSVVIDPAELFAAEPPTDSDIAIGRAPTKPLVDPDAMPNRLTLDFGDPDSVATLFDLAATLIRTRGRISITIE